MPDSMFDSLRSRIQHQMDDPAERRRRGASGRSFVQEWLDKEKTIRAYLAMYQTAIEENAKHA